MICSIRGKLIEAYPTYVVVETQGLGYEILISKLTFEQLPEIGGEVVFLTHFHVREDVQVLYGFFSAEEKNLFKLLFQSVSGIGPKISLAILGGLPVDSFKEAVVNEDVVILSKIPGLGKKTAMRIILELRDKVGIAKSWKDTPSKDQTPRERNYSDALLALISLGYKRANASKALTKIRGSGSNEKEENADFLIRKALKILTE